MQPCRSQQLPAGAAWHVAEPGMWQSPEHPWHRCPSQVPTTAAPSWDCWEARAELDKPSGPPQSWSRQKLPSQHRTHLSFSTCSSCPPWWRSRRCWSCCAPSSASPSGHRCSPQSPLTAPSAHLGCPSARGHDRATAVSQVTGTAPPEPPNRRGFAHQAPLKGLSVTHTAAVLAPNPPGSPWGH